MQCTAMQCNAIATVLNQCNAMQYNAMQCNAMQCNAMQCNAMVAAKKNIPIVSFIVLYAMQCNAMVAAMQWWQLQNYQIVNFINFLHLLLYRQINTDQSWFSLFSEIS